MPKRRSRRSSVTPEMIEELGGLIADLTPIVGEAKAIQEAIKFLKEEDYTGAALSAAGVVPFAGDAVKHLGKMARRDWSDIPLNTNSTKRATSDMREQFLEGHGFRPLDPNEAPKPDTYRYTDEGKIQAFSGVADNKGKVSVSSKTFDESTTLKTLRNF